MSFICYFICLLLEIIEKDFYSLNVYQKARKAFMHSHVYLCCCFETVYITEPQNRQSDEKIWDVRDEYITNLFALLSKTVSVSQRDFAFFQNIFGKNANMFVKERLGECESFEIYFSLLFIFFPPHCPFKGSVLYKPWLYKAMNIQLLPQPNSLYYIISLTLWFVLRKRGNFQQLMLKKLYGLLL